MNKNNNFLHALADLFLTDKSLEELKSDKKTLRDYHIFFSYCAISCVLYIFLPFFFNTSAVPLHALIVRILYITVLIVIIVSTIKFSVSYYIFSLTRVDSSHNHLGNVITLYFLVLSLFAIFYKSVYNISPISFVYQNAPYVTKQTTQYLSITNGTKAVLDFFIYSAANMTMSNYWKIQSRSYVVSIANSLQSLYSLFVIGLCVSTYVINIKTPKSPNK